MPPDVFDKANRSRIMSKIKGKGTVPELKMQALLEKWLPDHEIIAHPANLPGRPDFYIPGLKLAIFVDGCFFHGCPIHYRPPEDNKEYWRPKIKANKRRDRKVNRELRALGMRVLRIWEHELSGKKMPGRDRVRRRVRYAQALQVKAVQTRRVMEEEAPYDE